MAPDSPGLFSLCPFSGWPRASSGSTFLSQSWWHLLCESRDSGDCHIPPLHIHHVPCDLGYLGDCALFQQTHSHTLSLPRLREISRPDQVTLSQVQTDSWGGDPGGGCSYHLSPPTDFPLTQDIPRPLSRLDQFFYSFLEHKLPH